MFTDFKQSARPVKSIFFKGLILFLLTVGCSVVSCDKLAVSEQVDDAKQLRPIISLSGSLNSQTGLYKSKISVLLKNKNNKAVEIEGGMVKVNGYTMSPPSTALIGSDKHEDYVLYSDIIPDKLYVFEIVLSNDQSYGAWIESPEVFPTILNVPQRIERDKSLLVKWEKTDYRYPQYLILKNYDKDEGFSGEEQVRLKIDEPYYGKYTVDKKYIKYQNVSEQQVNEFRIILQAQTEGTLDQNFSQDGTIICIFKLYADMEIY